MKITSTNQARKLVECGDISTDTYISTVEGGFIVKDIKDGIIHAEELVDEDESYDAMECYWTYTDLIGKEV